MVHGFRAPGSAGRGSRSGPGRRSSRRAADQRRTDRSRSRSRATLFGSVGGVHPARRRQGTLPIPRRQPGPVVLSGWSGESSGRTWPERVWPIEDHPGSPLNTLRRAPLMFNARTHAVRPAAPTRAPQPEDLGDHPRAQTTARLRCRQDPRQTARPVSWRDPVPRGIAGPSRRRSARPPPAPLHRAVERRLRLCCGDHRLHRETDGIDATASNPGTEDSPGYRDSVGSNPGRVGGGVLVCDRVRPAAWHRHAPHHSDSQGPAGEVP